MDNLAHTQEWLRLAQMDLNSAEHLLTMHPAPIEIICYHCQQSAEKYLKGFLVFCGMIPPKTHDLDELCKLCTKSNNKFGDIADFCSDLTAYGVQPRYPMELYLEEQDMYQALKAAKVIRDFVLGMIPNI